MDESDEAKQLRHDQDAQRFAVALWEIKIRNVISNLGSTQEISPAIFALSHVATR